MDDVLTKEQVDEFQSQVEIAARGDGTGPTLAFVRLFCDSHEALRARVAELEGEVRDLRDVIALDSNALRERVQEVERLRLELDDKKDELRIAAFDRGASRSERDTAFARAEAAEAREAGLRSALEYIRELKRQFDDCALRVEELDAVIEIDETAANALAAAPAKDGGK